MKNIQIKIILKILTLVFSLISYNIGLADRCYNNLTLAAPASSAAVYTVNCPAGTHYLTAKVNLQSGAGIGQSVRLQIQRTGFTSSTVVTDTTNGGVFSAAPNCALPIGTVPSNWTKLWAGQKGAGNYNILITKFGTKSLRYGFSFECMKMCSYRLGGKIMVKFVPVTSPCQSF